jgi:hypothetical protein
VHLGHAAKRIAVLDAVAILVRLAESAPGEKMPQVPADAVCPGVRTRLVDRGSKATSVPSKASSEGADDVGGAHQTPGVDDRIRQERRDHLRPVDEREPIFGMELRRGKPSAREGGSALELLAAVHRFPFSYERERDVGEGREIPARSDRPLLGDDGVDAGIQHDDEGVESRSIPE